MSTQTSATRRQRLSEQKAQQALREARRRRIFRASTALLSALLVAIVGFGLWSAQPETGGPSGQAPAFTLPSTAGTTVSLADYRGKPVVLYFNEGAGCASCTQQMAMIEQNPGFAAAGITVLPIVMNSAAEIQPDLDRFGVRTPYLLDDGTVSKAYDTLDKGMHPGLPGHGFVLVNAAGEKLWHGNYPSMWLDPADLLTEVTARI